MSTKIVAASGDPVPAAAVAAATGALRRGQLVGLPTDTVYGLAADMGQPAALDLVFQAKDRPRTLELPVLVADIDQALALASSGEVPGWARELMEHHWPGPLTLVLRRRPGLVARLGTDETTVGVRCPDHPVALAVCRAWGPIATTSANRHGQPPATTAAEVASALGSVEVILDAGRCDGQPSTVVDATGAVPRLLRPGGVSWADLAP